MKRLALSVASSTIALSFMALSLISDPVAFVAGGSPPAGIAAHAQTAAVTPLSATPMPNEIRDAVADDCE